MPLLRAHVASSTTGVSMAESVGAPGAADLQQARVSAPNLSFKSRTMFFTVPE